jgi:hypothetical protein
MVTSGHEGQAGGSSTVGGVGLEQPSRGVPAVAHALGASVSEGLAERVGRLRQGFGALTRSRSRRSSRCVQARAKAIGGESGIRTFSPLLDSASYRFHNAADAVDAVDAGDAVAPCPPLPGASPSSPAKAYLAASEPRQAHRDPNGPFTMSYELEWRDTYWAADWSALRAAQTTPSPLRGRGFCL